MDTTRKLLHHLTDLIGLIANLLLVTMLLAIGLQVVARFVLGAPTMWAEELGRYLLAAITMLGSAVLMHRNQHISIDTFMAALPRKLRIVLGWLRDAISLSVCGLIGWYGWSLVEIGARQSSTGLPIKMSVPYLVIPLGAVLMALILMMSRLDALRKGGGF